MRWALSCLAAFGLASAAMAADEDKDLELIPRTEPAAKLPAAPQPAGQSARIYIENALTFNTLRNDLLVPAPPPLAPHWEERLLGDVRAEWSLAPNMLVAYS